MVGLITAFARFVHFCAALGLTVCAVAAALGFAHPLLDVLNHFQPVWFAGLLIVLLTTGVLYGSDRMRALTMTLGATGFLASAITVVPEFVSAWVTPPAAADGRPVYRLMSYNLFARNYDMAAAAEVILSEDADIVALQEYEPHLQRRLEPLLTGTYPYSVGCNNEKRANLAVYSRLPLTDTSDAVCRWDDDERTVLLTVPVTPDDGPAFTVGVTQLDWPVQISGLWRGDALSEKIDLMTERQRGQFDHLLTEVTRIDGPAIVVGDFNSTPWSYTLRGFGRAAGLERATKSLPTFPKLWFYFGDWRETPAIVPLDHVFARDGLTVTGIRLTPPAGSDHLPVVATFSVADQAPATASINP